MAGPGHGLASWSGEGGRYVLASGRGVAFRLTLLCTLGRLRLKHGVHRLCSDQPLSPDLHSR